MWDEAVRFERVAPSAHVSTGGVVGYSEGLDRASGVRWHGDRVKRALDELLQLWSILWGDMSFVGPRALRPGEIEVNGNGECVPLEAIFGYAERHAVRPGLTGLAQVYAPRDIPRHQKFRYDLLYIRRRTLWLDLRLIAVSLWISVRGHWG